MKKFIFIISVGRSGSTLLQSILNTHDNVVIRGENNNFFYYMMLAHESLLRDDGRKPAATNPTQPWYGFGNYDQKLFVNTVRKLGIKYMLGEFNSDQVEYLGFKEIRYFDFFERQKYGDKQPILKDSGDNGRRKLRELIIFLNKIFRPAFFILLERDGYEISKSGWWVKPGLYEKEKLAKDIAIFYKKTKRILTNNKLDFFTINYEALKNQNHKEIEKLFKKIGIQYNQTKCKEVLNTRLIHCMTQQQ